mmetsp:Transcript_5752/g.5564  ORF Transcript_5752/g.5564 Transcript_5752/m.5564 type:complete len:438 (+) Transcript_5752:36-1349(+)
MADSTPTTISATTMYVRKVVINILVGVCFLSLPLGTAISWQHKNMILDIICGNCIFAFVSSTSSSSSISTLSASISTSTLSHQSCCRHLRNSNFRHRVLFGSNNHKTEKSDNNDPLIIIDGKKTAAAIRKELEEEIKTIQNEHDGTIPGLAVVLVGERVDSATYVRMKKKAAAEIGIHSVDVTLNENISEDELIREVEKLNSDPKVHGILVQLPLPDHINEAKVLKTIKYEKDADGFDATNVGNMWLRGGEPPLAIPCTPAGCIELLQRYNIQISGKECVVLGRSNIVGMPISALLQSCNGTVTVCHSRTKNISEFVKRADILIAAIGKAEFVKGDWLKPGVVIVDVGINDKPDPTKKRGYRLVGDVDYDEAILKASAITPVPGGVGPMTIAMLMKNTVNLCRHSLGLSRLRLRDRLHDGEYVNTTSVTTTTAFTQL